MDVTKVEDTVYYKLGLRSIELAEQVIDGDVVEAYGGFSEEVKSNISIVEFSMMTPTMRDLMTSSIPTDGNLPLNWVRALPGLHRDSVGGIVIEARLLILALPNASETRTDVIDGYIAAALCNRASDWAPQKLDQWKYAEKNRTTQSYESITASSLVSATTVSSNVTLDEHTTHFMMFNEGRTKIQCVRFDFGSSELDENPDAAGDPRVIETDFLKALGLEASMMESLHIHARRLEMVQQVLFDLKPLFTETHTQTLFEHVLTLLLSDLDDTESSLKPHVEDVTGMEPMHVRVEVCKQYIQEQLQKKGMNQGTAQDVDVGLTIKSDLVVSMLSRDKSEGDGEEQLTRARRKKKRLLDCAYIIEMKPAHGDLRYSGKTSKSQLIAESLARSIELLIRDLKAPRVLFSVLCDCCSLHVLVHFPQEKRAFLSRREVEPGRMIAVLAWVHRAAGNGITMTELEKLFAIGDTFANEIRDRKTRSGRGPEIHPTSDKKQKAADSGNGRGPREREAKLVPLSFDDEEESEQERRSEKLDAFASYRNHYNLGWPLPLKRGVLESFTGPASAFRKHSRYAESISRMKEYYAGEE
jgi:hypothetical protein